MAGRFGGSGGPEPPQRDLQEGGGAQPSESPPWHRVMAKKPGGVLNQRSRLDPQNHPQDPQEQVQDILELMPHLFSSKSVVMVPISGQKNAGGGEGGVWGGFGGLGGLGVDFEVGRSVV